MLFISNGAGEDAIASLIGARLSRVDADAMPTVGTGAAYQGVLPLVGPRRSPLPSGGLVNDRFLPNLARDLRGGLLTLLWTHYRFLRGVRLNYQLFVVVGDVFNLLNAFAGLKPLLFIGTAKSARHHPYSWIERFAMKHLANRVLVRDEPTAAALRARGLEKASWVGNPMMDGLEPTRTELPLNGELPWICLFPGSRVDAYHQMPRMLDIYGRLWERGDRARAVVVLADSVDPAGFQSPGWRLEAVAGERGVVGELVREGVPPVLLVRRVLGDVLERCQLVLGQAGTANEQAAGMGLPVVAYGPGGEHGMSWYRFRQKGLLGEALEVVDDSTPELVVESLSRLLRNPDERARRGAVGRSRMGPPGGAARMAAIIEEMVLR